MMHRVFLVLFLSLMTTEARNSELSTAATTYIIHMDMAKVLDIERSLAGTRKWPEVILDSVRQAKIEEEPAELLYVYDTVLTGFAARLTPWQLTVIKHHKGFISAHPDKLLRLHTTHTPTFLGLEPGAGLWSSENLENDVIIGIIDTGISPEHISFHDAGLGPIPSRWNGECEATPDRFSCNRKIIGARVYWKGHQAMSGVKDDGTVDYLSARDSIGHGTHTASIAAGSRVAGANLFGYANGTASGIHNTARIAAYKVCWLYGCAESDTLAAIDQAVADGVDVLSISLGPGILSSSAFDQSVFAVAAFGAVQKGVFVSCSAGNSGPVESSVLNDAPWIMTVGASYMDRSFSALVKLGDGRSFVGASLYRGSDTGELPIAYDLNGDSWNSSRYCLSDTLSRGLVAGKLVLCDMGHGDPAEKGEEVKRAGGAGMLLLNREVQGEELFVKPYVLPATTVGAAAAAAIKEYKRYRSHATASIKFLGTEYGSSAPMITGFSSRGPSLAGPGVIKPDVIAPGMNVLAAWTPSVGPSLLQSDKRRVFFNVLSGTSMSCPHVSGVAALLKSLHQDWSPAAIKSAMMTTACTFDNTHSPIADISTQMPATPFALGSGHIDPERAAHPGLVYDIEPDDYLRFMCAMNYTSSQVALVSRRKFSCGESHGVHRAGWNLNYPSFSVLFHGGIRNETVVQRRTVTNVGPCHCSYTASLREPDGVAMTVQPRVLKFSKMGEKLAYKVTFTGLDPEKVHGYSFGELLWSCGKMQVRSPVAVAWGLQAWTD